MFQNTVQPTTPWFGVFGVRIQLDCEILIIPMLSKGGFIIILIAKDYNIL